MSNYTDYTTVKDPGFRQFLWEIGIQRYCILGRIGEGAFSKVLNAKRFSLTGGTPEETRYAIKLINFNGISDKYFYNERDILNTIHHSNIVEMVDNYQFIYEGEEFGALVSERMKCDLFDFIKKCSPSPKQIKFIFRKICRAMVYLYKKKIAHLDIKPDNVLINYVFTPKGKVKIKSVKICDFGCAVNMKKRKFLPPSFGTCDYKSPEAFSLSPSNDLFRFFNRSDNDDNNNNINNNNNNNQTSSSSSGGSSNENNNQNNNSNEQKERNNNNNLNNNNNNHNNNNSFKKKKKINYRRKKIDLEKMDVWSAGVLLFVIITHIKPFEIRPGHLHSYGLDLLREYPEGDLLINLLQLIFTIDPSERPNFQTILNHPYFLSDSNCNKKSKKDEEDEGEDEDEDDDSACDSKFTSIQMGKITKKEFQNSLKYYKK